MALRATCLRAGALRLALAMLLALLLVPGYLAAPVLFHYADSQATAGMLAGELFHVANRGVLLLGIAVAAFWLRMSGQGKLRWGVLLLVLLLVAVNEYALTPIMANIKQAMGPIDAVPKDDPERMRFGMWHGISALLHLLATLSAMLLVAIGQRREGESCRAS
jgi:hypothetical protein